MPHQIITSEITAAITGHSPIVLASSTKEQKQLLIDLHLSRHGSVGACFKVIQKGPIKTGQSLYPEGGENVVETDNSHYWIFHFVYDAINHYNSLF